MKKPDEMIEEGTEGFLTVWKPLEDTLVQFTGALSSSCGLLFFINGCKHEIRHSQNSPSFNLD